MTTAISASQSIRSFPAGTVISSPWLASAFGGFKKEGPVRHVVVELGGVVGVVAADTDDLRRLRGREHVDRGVVEGVLLAREGDGVGLGVVRSLADRAGRVAESRVVHTGPSNGLIKGLPEAVRCERAGRSISALAPAPAPSPRPVRTRVVEFGVVELGVVEADIRIDRRLVGVAAEQLRAGAAGGAVVVAPQRVGPNRDARDDRLVAAPADDAALERLAADDAGRLGPLRRRGDPVVDGADSAEPGEPCRRSSRRSAGGDNASPSAANASPKQRAEARSLPDRDGGDPEPDQQENAAQEVAGGATSGSPSPGAPVRRPGAGRRRR